MPELSLRFLGEVEVLRGAERQPLPPSKKTRALLAYLALRSRPARRDHLCELLWELPDDPRGSLRWSLSKLRRLVDDPDRRRIVADRTNVSFDRTDIRIDVLELEELADTGLERATIDTLEEAAGRFQGNFLEGLELTQLHGFHAWFVAERERVARAQSCLLEHLVGRLRDEPERAIPHARALVSRAPYDEALRADLIRLLVETGRANEAEQQCQLGERVLGEVGARSSGLLRDALSAGPPSAPPRDEGPPVVRRVPKATPASGEVFGRETELGLLEERFGAVTGGGRAVATLIEGEPGIGKSRLLERAAEMARDAGAYVLQASAFESEMIRPFGLWIDALRASPSGSADEVFGREEYDDRDRLFDGLAAIVSRESQKKPVALVFDDLQWCDESSAAALHYVVRTSQAFPLFVVLAARDAELSENSAMRRALAGLRRERLLDGVRLGPLSDEVIGKLVAERAPGAHQPIRSADCSGNPLLAIELAHAQQAGDAGDSLAQLVRERLSGLDLDGADVLRWAAVLAPRIDVNTLVRLTGLAANRVAAVLEEAVQIAILRPVEGGFRFSHDLIAQSVYADVSPTRRQVMHRRVAEQLEQDSTVDRGRAADLAHHAALSGDPRLASRAMVRAGRLCLRFFANDDALALATRGLHLVDQLSGAEQVCTQLDLHDVALAAAPLDDWESSAKAYVALAEQALDHGALSHARLGYHMASTVRWMRGQWTDARKETLQAERVARAGSEEDHVVGLAETAKCLAMLERDLSQADAMLMEAQALATRRRVVHHSIPAALGMLCFHRNELDAAEERFQEARALCKSAGERVDEFQANEYLVMLEIERGRPDAALSRCEDLLQIGERLREGSEAPFARALAGLCAFELGRGEQDLEAAIGELRVVDAKHRLAYVLTRASLVDLERGDPGRAIDRASEALRCAEAISRHTDLVMAHVALIEAYRAQDEPDQALPHLQMIAQLDGDLVATWARERASRLAPTARD